MSLSKVMMMKMMRIYIYIAGFEKIIKTSK